MSYTQFTLAIGVGLFIFSNSSFAAAYNRDSYKKFNDYKNRLIILKDKECNTGNNCEEIQSEIKKLIKNLTGLEKFTPALESGNTKKLIRGFKHFEKYIENLSIKNPKGVYRNCSECTNFESRIQFALKNFEEKKNNQQNAFCSSLPQPLITLPSVSGILDQHPGNYHEIPGKMRRLGYTTDPTAPFNSEKDFRNFYNYKYSGNAEIQKILKEGDHTQIPRDLKKLGYEIDPTASFNSKNDYRNLNNYNYIGNAEIQKILKESHHTQIPRDLKKLGYEIDPTASFNSGNDYRNLNNYNYIGNAEVQKILSGD
jgi:hypothetical protein